MDSFDLFETVFLRDVGNPSSLFLFIGHQGLKDGVLQISAEMFRRTRIEAEKEAYRQFGHPDLDDIYQVLRSFAKLEEEQLLKLKDTELHFEKAAIRLNPFFEEMIKISREKNGRVLYLSDMYLPKDFLEKNLRDRDLLKGEDRLYLSNQEKAGKGDGSLFKKVLEQESLDPSDLIHHGNCPHADFKAPSSMGIGTIHYNNGNLTQWEKFHESNSVDSDGLSSLWAGVSRRARCADSNITDHQIGKTAVSVAGPLLVTFVHWCLNNAAREGIKKLVFVARDGEVLFKIAKILHQGTPKYQSIQLKYIYGSRQAWRSASIFEFGEFEKSWIMEGDHAISRDKIVARLGLDATYTTKMPETEDPEKLWSGILENLRNPALQKATEKRDLVLKYLQQEGLFLEETGYVEIGCTGLTIAALEKVLTSAGESVPRSYFFGLSADSPSRAPSRASAFFYNSLNKTGFAPAPDFNYFVLLEMFCAANHGRTTGYKIRDTKVVPNMELPQKYWDGQREQVQHLQEGILAFAHQYVDSPLSIKDPNQALTTCAKVIRKYWQDPSQEEAESWGSYLKEHDQSGLDCLEMGRKLDLRDFSRCVLSQSMPDSWWPAATRRRTSQTTLKILQFGIFAGRQFTKARIGLGRLKETLLGQN